MRMIFLRPLARRPGRGVLVLALAGLTIAGAVGCAALMTQGSKAPMVKLDYEKYTLPNGLDVVLRRDPRLPIAAVNLWYHVGPSNETAGRTGFAHLFEHMMFQASGHVGDDQYFRILEGAGSSFVNGTTDFDRTNYMEDVPANQLELALWLESDRMGFLLDRLDQRMLSIQQGVVRNERRQSFENAPYGLAQEAVLHEMFPKGHPYHAMVIGSHADIQAAKLEDVRDFFTRYYAPNNASLAIVGDIDVQKTKALVDKYFGSIPRGAEVPKVEASTPPITSERRAVVTDKVELPRAYLAWITSTIFQPGDAEARIAAQILGGGKASRLYKSMVYDKKIAQSVAAEQQSLTLGSVFQITATAKPGHTAEEMETGVDAELARLASEGPTAEELSSAKNAIWAGTVKSLEHLGGFDGVADRLNLYNHHLGDPGYLNKDLARYGAVTADGVKRFAAEQLAKNKRVVVFGVPGDKVLAAEPPEVQAPPPVAMTTESKEPWRKEQPKPGPASTAPLPSAKRFELPNGLPVYLVEAHNLPIVAAHLVVRSGSAADPVALPGLAGYTASMLDEGTSKRDALGIARELEALGADLSTGSSNDGSFVTCKTLKQNASAALAVMSDVVLNPAFPDNEVERIRNDRLTALLQQRDSPFQTALRVMTVNLYGSEHPYGHVQLGTDDAIKKVKREDLVGFYQQGFSPNNAALVIAGDVTEAEARRLATEAFGEWKGSGQEAPKPAAGTPVKERVLVVNKPGSPQTAVLVGQMGVMRSDPSYEKLNVMNTILGGLFASRLNMNLREDKAWSYGAFSFLGENRGVGPLVIGAAVQTAFTGPSIAEMLKEAKGMMANEVTPDELTLAKESISRSLPALFETTSSTVGTVGSLYLHDQPPDYYESLPARLNSMSGAEVLDATRKHLNPDGMLVVAVGDRAKILPQIAKLELGPIGHRDPDGNVAGPVQ
ncbi:MAG TPA: pitrilysin family protein [Candidatus Limnocylindria bacterium]|nr:pitrilysin family protein [Candidatus Limnocylindria bacterium]